MQIIKGRGAKNMAKSIYQKGETIIEVLLAITILGAALGGAFAIVNRSKLTIEANKERYQAQLIANGQADNLKLYSSNTNGVADLNNSALTTNHFCLIDGVIKPYGAGTDCQIKIGGYDVTFDVHIYSDAAHQNKFDIKVQWDSLVNSTQDQIEVGYGI
jgi:Tfp pilus assembly protein PilV